MEWGKEEFLAGEDGEIDNFVAVRDDGGTMHDVEQELTFFWLNGGFQLDTPKNGETWTTTLSGSVRQGGHITRVTLGRR